jgi:hypothetical protein
VQAVPGEPPLLVGLPAQGIAPWMPLVVRHAV